MMSPTTLLPTLFLLAVMLFPATIQAAPSHAVVFMYHRFGESAHPSTNITLEQFDAQLEFLAGNGFQVWPLSRILQWLQAGRTLPDKVVAITIDDAYLSVYEQAYPRLIERGWPFTVFVSTDALDQQLPGFASWDQLREMQDRGVNFANHSASHDHLWQRRPGEKHETWRRRVDADIRRAQTRLQDELGAGTNTRPRLFAYPYGEYDRDLAERVRELGYVGLGQHSGALGANSDLRALPRYPMAEAFADLEQFARKAASLPLPVIRAEPWNPVLQDNPPRLELTLAPGDYIAGRLECYGSGLGRIEVKPIAGEKRRFTVTAPRPLPSGRSRYNCTAPARSDGRWYWYSHPWIVTSTLSR